MYRIRIAKDRPDFRVFIDLLYGKDRNVDDVDTDGDSDPVNSRTWTYLYIAESGSSVDIYASEADPSMFEVVSKTRALEDAAAIYLLQFCGSSISRDHRRLTDNEIDELTRLFAEELRRARNSIWHQSSDERPYPSNS